MESLLQLFNAREIQLLVALSFVLQILLFFTGSLRQRSTNMLLRGTIWIAYLGADLVAVYALGFLSRHEKATTERGTFRGTHPLAFFWAPFLLVHLGGQNIITAFAIEDNSMWLRHLLNLIVQVVLALYVFWKSTGWRNVQLLVPGIFVFVAGIIKYGERTLALMHGNLKNIRGSNNEENEGRVKSMITKMAKAVGAGEWMSKLLDTKYAEVDKEIMVCFVERMQAWIKWEHLGPLLNRILQMFGAEYDYAIV